MVKEKVVYIVKFVKRAPLESIPVKPLAIFETESGADLWVQRAKGKGDGRSFEVEACPVSSIRDDLSDHKVAHESPVGQVEAKPTDTKKTLMEEIEKIEACALMEIDFILIGSEVRTGRSIPKASLPAYNVSRLREAFERLGEVGVDRSFESKQRFLDWAVDKLIVGWDRQVLKKDTELKGVPSCGK